MPPEEASRCERARKYCIKNVLPLGFALALVIALVWPWPGKQVSKPEVEGFRVLQTLNVVIIFIISGLTLKTDDIKTALSKEGIGGFGFGVVSILFITSCVGFAAAEIPFDKPEFAYGLAVFCVVPTTLSSGVTLVMNVGGVGIVYSTVVFVDSSERTVCTCVCIYCASVSACFFYVLVRSRDAGVGVVAKLLDEQ